MAFGVESVEINQYAEAKLGREVAKRAALGHDGKYFFVQANDPLVLEPEENIAVVDRPLYRSQRMLYPILAGGAGLFSPDVIVWALLIVNLIAMGFGTWAVAELAMEMGGSPWWGLAFVLNIGFISEMNIDGAGVVAAAAAFGAVVMLLKERLGWAIALLTIAVLSREAMLIAAAGSAFWLWRRGEKRSAVLVAGIPTAAVALWAIYLRFRIEFDTGVSEVQEIGLPFAGFAQSFKIWADDPLNLVAGVAICSCSLMFTRRVLMSRHLVGLGLSRFRPAGHPLHPSRCGRTTSTSPGRSPRCSPPSCSWCFSPGANPNEQVFAPDLDYTVVTKATHGRSVVHRLDPDQGRP